MSSEPIPKPDERELIIYVGRDKGGHRLVKDSGRKLEGRFVSRAAASSFAEGECQIYHARLEIAAASVVPLVPFGLVTAGEYAVPRAV